MIILLYICSYVPRNLSARLNGWLYRQARYIMGGMVWAVSERTPEWLVVRARYIMGGMVWAVSERTPEWLVVRARYIMGGMVWAVLGSGSSGIAESGNLLYG